MIDILLATYNGEKYLPEQIDSLFSQSYKDWRLIIRDDGSTDTTLSFITNLEKEFPGKVLVLKDSLGNLGAAQSFSRLLEVSNAPYVAFCDQDDIWFKNKLQLQMQHMLLEESKQSEKVPVLINSDLVVVDQNMDVISSSFWKYQNLKPGKMNNIKTLLIHNYVTGCTCLLNRELINTAMPIQDGAIMHDWWIAIVAVSNGRIIDLDVPTVYYRQHNSNDVGAKAWGVYYVYDLIFNSFSSIREALLNTRRQANALQNNECLREVNRELIKAYVNLFEMNWLSRHVKVFKLGFKKYGLIRNLAFLLFV